MSLSPPAERTLTQLDYVRLTRLLTVAGDAGGMREVLAASDLVASPAVAPSVATMYSQLLVREATLAAPVKLTLCYPDDAEPARGFISVLSPLGTALLGRRSGETVHWTAPGGQPRATHILELLFQPEATGDYTT